MTQAPDRADRLPHLIEHLREGGEAAKAPEGRTFGVSNWRAWRSGAASNVHRDVSHNGSF